MHAIQIVSRSWEGQRSGVLSIYNLDPKINHIQKRTSDYSLFLLLPILVCLSRINFQNSSGTFAVFYILSHCMQKGFHIHTHKKLLTTLYLDDSSNMVSLNSITFVIKKALKTI